MELKQISDDAAIFIRLIKTGVLPKEILPNSSPNYTYAQEEQDTDYYINVFLNSSAYDLIKDNEEVNYNGE